MIPLSLADIGKEHLIQKISGNTEIKKHLEDLGFTTGTKVVLISTLGENAIVAVKGARIALGADMARKIMV